MGGGLRPAAGGLIFLLLAWPPGQASSVAPSPVPASPTPSSAALAEPPEPSPVVADPSTLERGPSCRISEWQCATSGRCVALDAYCDGQDDCGDKSDEPRYCSPCNRTYYGDVGRTYELEVRRPREDRLPFLCHLNFTAAGSELGDLVQLTFDTFTVGKFVSFTTDGCPDGHMSIREAGRPDAGGRWCGSAWGYTVYYSETRSLNLTLQLYRLSEQGIGYNFDFKLAYKFLRRSEAGLRYGNSSVSLWRGELVPGTYCDRVLDGCDRRACRLQSPNYPGVYPRNLTCRYRLSQRSAPPGHHALIAVSQRNSHKVHIKDQIVKYDRSQRVLRLWDQCNVVQDYLTVYDGDRTESPVLVRLCGGDAVPDIVSSGPDMLLVFHTSPFDNPFHPVPLSYLPGFELDVQVMYVESRSHSYVRDPAHCEFLLTSFDSPWGVVENPRHSLPPNTTCRYHFQGRRREIVWLAFLKYHASSADAAPYEGQECGVRLRVWDGRLAAPGQPAPMQSNVTLVGEFCRDEVPRLCDHALLSNATRFTRPCSLAESYVSTGPELTVEQALSQGTALYPVTFTLRYEFVDTSLEGAPLKPQTHNSGLNAALDGGGCDRIFSWTPHGPTSGKFQSPRSVFLYGRGGAANVSCTLRFDVSAALGSSEVNAPSTKIRLTLNRGRFGGRKCTSRPDPRTARWRCDRDQRNSRSIAELWISEYPWPGVQLPRHCLCSRITQSLTFTLVSSIVEVNFTVTHMNITEDFTDFHFEGEYEFVISEPSSTPCVATARDERRVSGSSGEISLRTPPAPAPSPPEMPPDNELAAALESDEPYLTDEEVGCSGYPWLIEPEDPTNNFLYLKVPGYELVSSSDSCHTANRVVVYSGLDTRSPRIVCPTYRFRFGSIGQGNNIGNGINGQNVIPPVEMFSAGWERNGSSGSSASSRAVLLFAPHARSLVVELLPREHGASYTVSWMEVSKRPLLTAASSSFTSISSSTSPGSSAAAANAPPPASPPDCPFRCPELNACISAALWCDGERHCPSGFDEADVNCAYQLPVPTLYVATGAAAIGLLAISIAITACIKLRRSAANKPGSGLTSGAAVGGPGGPVTAAALNATVGKPHGNRHVVVGAGGGGMGIPGVAATHRHHHHHHRAHNGSADKRYHPGADDLYMDGKDSLC